MKLCSAGTVELVCDLLCVCEGMLLSHVCTIKTLQAMSLPPWNAALVWRAQFCGFSGGIGSTGRDKRLRINFLLILAFQGTS